MKTSRTTKLAIAAMIVMAGAAHAAPIIIVRPAPVIVRAPAPVVRAPAPAPKPVTKPVPAQEYRSTAPSYIVPPSIGVTRNSCSEEERRRRQATTGASTCQ